MPGKGLPEPEAPLQEHVDWYVGQGYHVISQTETSAQLVMPKQFSFVWAMVWILLALVGLLAYILYHLVVKKERTVHLTVEADGKVNVA